MDHLSSEQMQRWRSRSMEPQELLAVGAHFSVCQRCREALLSARSLDQGVEEIRRLLETADATESGVGDPSVVMVHDTEREVPRIPLDELDTSLDRLHGFDHGHPTRRVGWQRNRSLWAMAAGLAAVLISATTWMVLDASTTLSSPQSTTRLAGDMIVELQDRHGRVALHANGTVEGVPATIEAVTARWLRPSASLSVPASVRDIASPDGRLRGERSANRDSLPVEIIGPKATVLIETQPVFRWRGPAGGNFLVQVFDSNLNRVDLSESISATQWRPLRALPRAEILTWQVTTTLAGKTFKYPSPPTPLAVFRIVSEAEAAKIEAARAMGSHLLLAIALWESGCISPAAAEFERLYELNPKSSVAERWASESRRLASSLEVEIDRP